MNRDNPTLRWLVWPVFLVVLVPYLYFFLFHNWYGVVPIVLSGRPTVMWPWLLLLAGYALPVLALLRWKRLATAVTLTLFLGYSQTICESFLAAKQKTVYVEFGDNHNESGVDVYCNGVKLGTTPFVMSAAEFYAKVKPWTRPPEQPAVWYQAKDDGSPQGKDFSWWQWTWTPGDPFPWPQDFQIHQRYSKPENLLAYWKTAPYWFRFEKDGCLTLRMMHEFSGGGGGSNVIRLQLGLGLHIPVKQQMHELALAGLQVRDYKPSAEWTAFVLKYRDEVLDSLIQESENDPRLLAVLDRLADDHFELSPDANLEACRQVLQRTFDNASDKDGADFDWFGYRTALRIVQKYPQLLVEQTWQEMGPSPGVWHVKFRSNDRRRQDLLLNLLSEVSPPQLFDLLVYLQGLQQQFWAGGRESRLIIAIGNSGRSEALPIVRKYFDDIWNPRDPQRGFMQDHEQEASIKVMTRLNLPELEDTFWYLVSQKIKPNHFIKYGPLPKFIQSRIARGGDVERLVHRITSCETLSDEQKGPLLAQVNHPAAGVWLTVAADRLGDYQRDEMMNEICKLPANPATGKFLVETWRRKNTLHRGTVNDSWNLAILRIDTPEVREFMLERLQEEDPPNQFPQWSNITSLPEPVVPGRLAHHNWFVAELRKAPEDRRNGALTLLLEIGTPDARALLQEWADDPNNGIRNNAKAILKRPTEQANRKQQLTTEQLAKVNGLLTGRIKPDNLLRAYPSAHWTGDTYVPVLPPKPAK